MVVAIIRFGFRILHINLSESQMNGFLQFIKFGIIGVSNTVVSYVIYLGTLWFLQSRNLFPKIDYMIGNITGFLISVLWSFYWNRRFVFKAKEGEVIPWPQALLKTYISYGFTGLILNNILSALWVELLGVSKVVAPLLNIVIQVPINFLMNKFWAFRGKKEES